MSTVMLGEQGVDSYEKEVANCLIVKLKLKKNVGDHVCKVCKKCFPSGKALGGHMRIHNEEWEGGKKHKVVVPGGGGKREVEVHDLSSTTCKLCYREFPSMKSLFGHMRCHPEREWRGINPPLSYPLPPPPSPPPTPPPLLKNSWSSTLSDTTLAQTDSGEEHGFRSGDGSSLKSWPVTARRALHDSSPMSLFDSAVEALCMLSRGENLNIKKGEEEDDDDYSGYSIAALYESGNESDDKSKIDKLEIGPCRIESNQNTMSRKKVTKKRKLSALSGNGRYNCSTCNKSFHSHRALGGHRSSHKKNKNPRYASDEEGELVNELAAAAGAEDTGAEMAATTPAVAVHRCEVCEKTFPSGQALGGHKRRHWVNPAEATSSWSLASPEEKKAAGAGGRVMEFDLNEPPPME